MSPTAVGWDGCPPCFGCQLCVEVEGDCCIDCEWESQTYFTSPHDDVCSTCHCDGSTVGARYSNLECNCEHDCSEGNEASA